MNTCKDCAGFAVAVTTTGTVQCPKCRGTGKATA